MVLFYSINLMRSQSSVSSLIAYWCSTIWPKFIHQWAVLKQEEIRGQDTALPPLAQIKKADFHKIIKNADQKQDSVLQKRRLCQSLHILYLLCSLYGHFWPEEVPHDDSCNGPHLQIPTNAMTTRPQSASSIKQWAQIQKFGEIQCQPTLI